MGPIGERPAMGAYGVDTPEWQALPWDWAAERLGSNRNYWVVTVGPDGSPHAMPVWGVWRDDEQRFMFSCAPTARKARNIAANPRVVVAIDDTVECVSLQGLAAPVTERDRIDEWAQRYAAKYATDDPQAMAEFVSQHAMFEVTPTTAFAIIERETEFATRATRWRF